MDTEGRTDGRMRQRDVSIPLTYNFVVRYRALATKLQEKKLLSFFAKQSTQNI